MITEDDRELVKNSTYQAQFNTKLINWELFTLTLQQLVSSHNLDQLQNSTVNSLKSASTSLTEFIIKAAKTSISILWSEAHSKS